MSDPAPAAEARRIVAAQASGTLATLTAAGHPWASLVLYALTPAGAPILLVSTMAEHGRNLAGDPRASLAVAAPVPDGEDPLEHLRTTLAGRAVASTDAALRDAFVARHPSAAQYAAFADFTVLLLEVERIRWVGGFALMGSASGAQYAAAGR